MKKIILPKTNVQSLIEGEFFAVCPKGLEEILEQELNQIGATDIIKSTGGAWFSGGTELLYKSNLHLRTASRILKNLRQFTCLNEIMLYDQIRRMKWEELIPLDKTFSIDCTLFNSNLSNSHYVELKTKDAIVDRQKEKLGERSSVSKDNPDFKLNLFINNNKCILSMDSSGRPLHERGYRSAGGGDAPLKENLAAGLLLLTGYDGSQPLFDPMCGSGTLLVEASLIKLNIAPGLLRKDFGFLHWSDLDQRLWNEVVAKARKAIKNISDLEIYGCDESSEQLKIAQWALKKLELENKVKVQRLNAFTAIQGSLVDTDAASMQKVYFGKAIGNGMLLTNPPYGERLEPEDLDLLYKTLGDLFKKAFKGWTAWVFSANRDALKRVGLKTFKKIPLFNGALDARLQGYRLF